VVSTTLPAVAVAPTTVKPSPPTTVHDHSTHSHGPLPQTGSGVMPYLVIALYLIAIGLAAVSLSPRALRWLSKWKQ
jgi:hypothetical protein